MSSKPIVALNADFREARKDAPAFTYVSSGYYDALIQAGTIPVILPPYSSREDLQDVLSMVDAVMMVGGADLDPMNDGYMLHPSMRTMETRRESFDRMLIDEVSDRRLPFLGVGAGMQLLNISQGGNLFFHIPEDLPRALPHRDSMDPHHRHSLVVEEGSIMEQVYGEGEIRVNSMHHMSIDDVAPGFWVTARCPDGVVEAIESIRDDWFALGTQFHPEATSATALDMRIFHEFVQGVTWIRNANRMVA
jgi:putative glutamine amidotransferase